MIIGPLITLYHAIFHIVIFHLEITYNANSTFAYKATLSPTDTDI